jgi:hypothetical protein
MVFLAGFKKKLRLYVELKIYDKNRRKITGLQCVNLFILHRFVTVRYQKAWREYVKFRHLLANMPKPSFEDKRKLESKENKLQEMRTQSKMKRDVTVAVSSKGFHRTGIMCDIIQVGAGAWCSFVIVCCVDTIFKSNFGNDL